MHLLAHASVMCDETAHDASFHNTMCTKITRVSVSQECYGDDDVDYCNLCKEYATTY